jgi:type II secretion system protein G
MMHKNKTRGFTLIELLVVISIIGVLGAIILASVHKAAVKARDTNRKATLRNLKTALELFYADNGRYPSTGGVWYSSEPGNVPENGPGNNGVWIPELVAGGYIKELPRDPLLGRGDNNPNKCSLFGWIGAYDYKSDGTNYKLLSHCAPEFMIGNVWDTPGSGFYDPGAWPTFDRFTHAWMICSGEPACTQW